MYSRIISTSLDIKPEADNFIIAFDNIKNPSQTVFKDYYVHILYHGGLMAGKSSRVNPVYSLRIPIDENVYHIDCFGSSNPHDLSNKNQSYKISVLERETTETLYKIQIKKVGPLQSPFVFLLNYVDKDLDQQKYEVQTYLKILNEEILKIKLLNS